jgi:putative tryptophan/tyrosine transport system substrate-binding protein
MTRRHAIALLGAAAAWPLATRAQQLTVPVIGFLSGRSPGESASVEAAFRQGLQETGYVEGQNVHIALRWADGRYARLPELAADLVGRRVTVLVSVGGEVVALAAKAATTTIPIVFVMGSDPVEAGLVASLNQPGGNITGATLLAGPLGAKRVELMHELVPRATVVAFLVNPNHPRADLDIAETHEAAQKLRQTVRVVGARTVSDLQPAFASIIQQRADALIVNRDGFLNSQREQVVVLAARHALPAIYESREHVEAGGLMSYGPSYSDTYRKAGIYTGQILKGVKPSELPVLQPAKFELVINLKTAKAIGLDVPPTLIARSDEVIE